MPNSNTERTPDAKIPARVHQRGIDVCSLKYRHRFIYRKTFRDAAEIQTDTGTPESDPIATQQLHIGKRGLGFNWFFIEWWKESSPLEDWSDSWIEESTRKQMEILSHRKHLKRPLVNCYRPVEGFSIHAGKHAVWIMETHLLMNHRDRSKSALDRSLRSLLLVRTDRDFHDRTEQRSRSSQLIAGRLHR
jgi:hypothetical protein